jgi:hypothetical protein
LSLLEQSDFEVLTRRINVPKRKKIGALVRAFTLRSL